LNKTNDVILFCGVQLKRNYATLPFYHKMDDEQKNELKNRIADALTEGNAPIEKLNEDAPEALEEMLTNAAFADKTQAQAGARLKIQNTCVYVGPMDHASISAFASGSDFAPAIEACTVAQQLLSSGGEFAFDKNWGYLTASIMDTGNAARAMFLVHLQGLGRLDKLEEVSKELRDKGLEIRRFLSGDGLNAELFVITSRVNLGKLFSQISAEALEAVNDLVYREREAREELIYDDMDRYADDVMRAMGLLLNARLMAFDELLDIYADARAGLTGGMLTGKLEDIDDFVFALSPSKLNAEFEGLSQRDDELIRADRVRRRFAERIIIKKI